MSYMGMNILEYIDWLMDQGMSEEDAEPRGLRSLRASTRRGTADYERLEKPHPGGAQGGNGTRSLESTPESSV